MKGLPGVHPKDPFPWLTLHDELKLEDGVYTQKSHFMATIPHAKELANQACCPYPSPLQLPPVPCVDPP